MGIYQGGFGLTRYRVLGSVGKQSIETLSEYVQKSLAPKIKIDGPVRQEAIGWVRPLTLSDEETVSEDSHWDFSDCQVDDGYLLRVRFEMRKVPSSLIQTLYRTKIRDHLQKTGKAMPRKDRQEYKQSLVQDLTKRCLPIIQFTDAYWRIDQNELHVYSTSVKERERFETLFLKTFGTGLGIQLFKLSGPQVFLDPRNNASTKLSKQVNILSKLEPSVFAAQAGIR